MHHSPKVTPNNHPHSIKAVFFDIDGTLVSFKTHTIPDSTEKALKELRQNGIKVITATGRSIGALESLRYLDFDGFVTFNGGYCITKESEVLLKEEINPSDIKQLLDYSLDQSLNFSLMYQNKVLVNEITPDIVRMHQHVGLPLPPLVDRNNIDFSDIMQTNVFISPEREKAFMENIMPNCTSSRWTPLFADVNPKNISKKVGLDAFCKHLSIDISETMSFGDGGNDITMLRHAGIGVAMGNASPHVKESADYITDDSDSDGILNALRYFGLL